MHIGLDLDGVLADLVGATVQLYNITWPNDRINYEDIDGWDYLKREKGISGKLQNQLFNQVWQEFDRLPTAEKRIDIEATLEILKEQGHIISIITHRDMRTHTYVPRWLFAKKIFHHNLMFLDTRIPLEKHDFVDILVDDHPRTVELAETYPNTFVLLRDQPWNRHVNVDISNNTARINSLKDLPGFIANIKSKRSINAF